MLITRMLVIVTMLVLSASGLEVSLMLLAGPKRRPELDRSSHDLFYVIHNIPEGMNVTLYMQKGCVECEFHDFDEILRLFKNDKALTTLEFSCNEPELQRDYMSPIVDDMYVSLDYKYRRRDWLRPYKLRKHYTINYYYYQMAKHVYETTHTDLFVFIEDDITYDKNMLRELMRMYKEKDFDEFCYEKVTPYMYGVKVNGTMDVSYKTKQWGYYGLVRTRKQMQQFFKVMKFLRYAESGDALGGMFCNAARKDFLVMNLSRHFGKDKVIPPVE